MLVSDELLAQRVAEARRGSFYERYLAGKTCETRADLQNLPISSRDNLGSDGLGGLYCAHPETSGEGAVRTFLEEFVPAESLGPLIEVPGDKPPEFASPTTVVGGGPGPDFSTSSWSSGTLSETIAALHIQQSIVVKGDARLLLLFAEAALSAGDPMPASVELVLATGLMPSSLRSRIEDLWGARVVEIFQKPEAPVLGASCAEGSLHLANDLYACEILDPEDGKPVPPGGRGVLVVTSLQPMSYPLVRWSSGELVEMAATACKCQRPDFPVSRLGEAAAAVAFGGREATANQILDAAQGFAAALGTEIFHTAIRAGDLRILVEVADPEISLPTKEHLDLRRQIGLPMDVRLVPRGSISGSLSLELAIGEPACQLWRLADWSEHVPDSGPGSGLSLRGLLAPGGWDAYRKVRRRRAHQRSLRRAIESAEAS
jgi:hypothetical protein